jgi:DNA-binding IclR family transcriptional regulator
VATLVAAGFAEQNPASRKYRPGRTLISLAQSARRTVSAREIAHRQLADLAREVHETVNLAILSDGMVLYVDKVTSDQPFGIEARVGSRLPAYCTALGKVLVAGLDEAGRANYLAGLRNARRRETRPVPTQAAFRAEIDAVREEGYALDRGEYLPDVYCAAAPVVGAGGVVVAAISVSVPRSRFDAERDRLVRELQAAAATLSTTLGELGLPGAPEELVADALA